MMAPSTVTQQQLEAALWDAANALRGPIDPADFKTYVFPVLFFKWLDDTWHMHHQRAVDDFGDALTDDIEADYHPFSVPDGCHWSDVRNAKPGTLGATLHRTLQKLEQANPDRLANVFGDAQWANTDRLPERALRDLIDAFDRLTLDPEHVPNDVLGGAYEYLLRAFADASGRKAGEFFTPRAVVRLLVKALDPQPGETVYDPACGSGGMLVETIGQVREDGADPRQLRLYGQEVSLTTSSIARMNLFIHDIEEFEIVRGDTLRDPKLRQPDGHIRQFDVVIANPPFSLENWGADDWVTDSRAQGGVPPNKSGDYAWVQHMVASAGQDGRVGVVLPLGTLSRLRSEQQIRRHLVEQRIIRQIVLLPPRLFYNTPIQAVLVIIGQGENESIRFVDGSERFRQVVNGNEMGEEDIQAIWTVCKSGESGGQVSTRDVPVTEIATADYDLSPAKYLPVKHVGYEGPSAGVVIKEAQDASRRCSSLLDAVAAILDAVADYESDPGHWESDRAGNLSVQVKDSVPVERGRDYRLLGVRSKGRGTFEREVVTAETTKASKFFRVQPGDFVYNRLFASTGSFALILPENEGAFVSGEFPMFRIDASRILPEFFNLWFQLPQVVSSVAAQCTGTTKSRLRWKVKDFQDFKVSYPRSLKDQQAVIDVVKAVDHARDQVAELGGASHDGSLSLLRAAVLDELVVARRPVPHVAHSAMREHLA